MILAFRPIKVWPEGWSRDRLPNDWAPFTASYSDTLTLLDRELRHLGATDVVLQVDVTERDCRLDGQLRSDARVQYPGVILSFRSARFGTLSYACNRFLGRGKVSGWQANLRAIALGLEALRRVERYGIADRGQQYAGWAELPSGIAVGPASFTVESAALFIARHATADGGWESDVAQDPSFALAIWRDAVKVHHPDAGGDPAVFRRLVEARELLLAAFPERVDA